MTRNPDDLEKDIERTRAKLDTTIERLQDRITLSGIVDDLLGSARKGRYATLFENVLDTIKRHPIPVLLVAAGVGYLVRHARHRPPAQHRSTRLMDEEDVMGEPEDFRLYGSGASPFQPPEEALERRRVTTSRI
ncbi:DUF3618 domain-containing protein [Microvirga terricola]|uniref:DUF3618 domain-containing protein n=1 Tax=Microvirga terricola TaxID=2719797 RepID=A0ABX0V9B6_9HYPH|nr:DUF3618 domain-containing protein [Microvirga terricola]NIX76143.1 DUF3618 domain-containing protein [Microvirga terricola]